MKLWMKILSRLIENQFSLSYPVKENSRIDFLCVIRFSVIENLDENSQSLECRILELIFAVLSTIRLVKLLMKIHSRLKGEFESRFSLYYAVLVK